MVVGRGDIGSILPDRRGWTFFASGVSNSQEDREHEYKREFDLLMSQNKLRHLVYFSSMAIFYSDTRYTHHKRQMEEVVKSNFPHHTIVRLGNISWGDNPHTIINYFREKLRKGESVEIRDEYRYIVDKKEFLHHMKQLPDWNCEYNITGKLMKVEEIVEEYCGYPSLSATAI